MGTTYLSSGFPLIDAFLFCAQENMNVFLVDWAGGSRDLYTQSVQNTRVVGRVIARFIQFLQDQTGIGFNRVWLIGHSLGAHISGYAGAFQPGLARITGTAERPSAERKQRPGDKTIKQRVASCQSLHLIHRRKELSPYLFSLSAE